MRSYGVRERFSRQRAEPVLLVRIEAAARQRRVHSGCRSTTTARLRVYRLAASVLALNRTQTLTLFGLLVSYCR